MIRSYANSPDPAESLKIFRRMRQNGIHADSYSYPFVIMACRKGLRVWDGRGVHGLVVKDGLGGDKYVGDALLRMYTEFDEIVMGRKVFDEMPERDVTSWSLLIAAYVTCDCPNDALEVFRSMIRNNIKPNNVTLVSLLPSCGHVSNRMAGLSVHSHIVVNSLCLDSALGTALLSMYSQRGSIESAVRVFRSIEQKNLQCWTVMLSCLAHHGRGEDAIALFTEMENSGVTPDSLAFTVILTCCSHSGLVDKGWKYFQSMKGDYGLEPSMEHYGCMVDILGRAGLIDEAYGIIKIMPMGPNPVILRSFIASCRYHGLVVEGDDELRRLLIESEPNVGANYVLAANAASLSSSWSHVADTRLSMKKIGLKKVPGYSWMEGSDGFVQEALTVFTGG
ncbi:hypothetical protein MLD38_003392 [Melastoma candidum]|uniref:Uncharacterized protein n=1 Tax=Melastoma candidum TaxID=119954 RepID=A0ACB9S337_9MYRT|nr:hypothetical protein MLD38_003392 [Melastoma candidum]